MWKLHTEKLIHLELLHVISLVSAKQLPNQLKKLLCFSSYISEKMVKIRSETFSLTEMFL